MNKEEIDEIDKLEIDFNDIDELNLALEVSSKKAMYLLDEFSETIINLQQENKQLREKIKQYQKELEKADSITQSCIFQGKKESEISFRNCLNKMNDYKTRIDKSIECLEDIDECDVHDYILQTKEALEILKNKNNLHHN